MLNPTKPATLTRTPNSIASAAASRSVVRRHLKADLRHAARNRRADVRDSRRARSAAEALGKLPGPRESVHIVISGRYSLWDMVPALISIAGPIERLHISTLSFSRRSIDALANALDEGRIGSVRLLCSRCFVGYSPELHKHGVDAFGRRPGAEMLALRIHAKILLARMRSGPTYTLESSANLRGCKSIEQLAIFGSRELYGFHAAWIDDLFAAGADLIGNSYSGTRRREESDE